MEMDIMNTLEVQEVRSSGTLGGLGEEGENGATREKRGATSNSFALWTDNIVPYAFQAFGKLCYFNTTIASWWCGYLQLLAWLSFLACILLPSHPV